MKSIRQFTVLALLFFAGLVLPGCQDPSMVVDINKDIKDRVWGYNEKVIVPVKIDSIKIPYNIYINLRHTDVYKYSNIFLMIHETGPGLKKKSERKELRLALPTGEWLGKGSGNLYSYQILYKENYYFPKKGTYIFELEQNMRDNPLREISDAGIRVEKVL